MNSVQISQRETIAEERIEPLNNLDKIRRLPYQPMKVNDELQTLLSTIPDDQLFAHLNQLVLMYSSVILPAISALRGSELPNNTVLPRYNDQFKLIDDFIITYMQKWVGISTNENGTAELNTRKFFDFTKEVIEAFVPSDSTEMFYIYSFTEHKHTPGEKVFGPWAKGLLKFLGISLTKGLKERITSDQIDLGKRVNPDLINQHYLTFQNGDAELFGDYNLVPHSPGHLTTRSVPVSLIEGDTSVADEYLESTFPEDPETQAVIWTMWGSEYSVVSTETGFFFVGEGSNGKSITIFISRELVGIENVSGAALADLNGKFGFGALVNPMTHEPAMLMASEENQHRSHGDSTVLDMNNAKLILGDGTYVLVNPKGRQQFSVKLKNVSVQQSMNTIPDIIEGTYAVERRIRAIPFEVTFDETNRDPLLKQKLLEQIDAIAYKAWSHYKAYRLSGVKAFPESKRMLAFKKNEFLSKKQQPSIVEQFINEKIMADPNGRVSKNEITEQLSAFADQLNENVGRFTGKSLWQEWRRVSSIPFVDKSSNGVSYVLGIKIIDN